MRTEYKVEILRVAKPRLLASKDVEKFINEYSSKGWTMYRMNFDSQILAYEIVFTRNVKD